MTRESRLEAALRRLMATMLPEDTLGRPRREYDAARAVLAEPVGPDVDEDWQPVFRADKTVVNQDSWWLEEQARLEAELSSARAEVERLKAERCSCVRAIRCPECRADIADLRSRGDALATAVEDEEAGWDEALAAAAAWKGEP